MEKKNKSKRYDTSGMLEAQFEPGSNDKVLKNLLKIKTVEEMDQAEALALKDAQDTLIKSYGGDHQFTAKDICHMHKIWLGKIYAWAGEYRRVNLAKDDFKFATAAHKPQLMQSFEEEFLCKHTPCLLKKDDVARALAEVHVELVLIHPFREGNGRSSRLLAILMALQAGLGRNYKPMEEVFKRIIEKSVSRVKK